MVMMTERATEKGRYECSVEHRIVVPSVVGSSPIIHPKRVPARGDSFLLVDDGTGAAEAALFSMPHPLPPPEGGAAAEAAGAPPALLSSVI